jgi:peptide/nickel transport system substrate-binding protein
MAITTTAPWLRRGLGRRALLRRAALGSGALAVGYALACSGSEEKQETSTGGSSAAGGGSTSKSAPLTGRETVEELRERFHGRELKALPGQQNGPKYGGVYRRRSNLPITWDFTAPQGALLASYAFFHNALITFAAGDFVPNHNQWTIEGDMAQKWEQPDGTTFTFKLQPNIKWQNLPPVNGRAFTSEDAKYVLDVYKKAPAQAPIFQHVDRVETPDKDTVTIKMVQPTAYFLLQQLQPFALYFSREQHQSADGLKTGPIGTGAFIFEQGQQNVGFTAKKNPDYFKKDARTGKQLPYVDRVESKFFPDFATALAAFRDEQTDEYYLQSPREIRDLLKTNPNSVIQITTPPPSYQPHVAMRLDKPPFNDVRVRRAMSMALDRDAIIDGVTDGFAGYGYAQDWTYFGQEWPWTQKDVGDFNKFNLAEAKKLMEAAGYSNGFGRTIKFALPTTPSGLYYDTFVLMADQWRQLGIQTEIWAPSDVAQVYNQYYGGNFDDLVGTGVIGPGIDPDAFAYEPIHSKSPKNYYLIKDAQMDTWAEAQRVEMDTEQRKKILRQIMDRDIDQMYRIWGITPYRIRMRHPYAFNITDEIGAWEPGWGSRGVELVWMNK